MHGKPTQKRQEAPCQRACNELNAALRKAGCAAKTHSFQLGVRRSGTVAPGHVTPVIAARRGGMRIICKSRQTRLLTLVVYRSTAWTTTASPESIVCPITVQWCFAVSGTLMYRVEAQCEKERIKSTHRNLKCTTVHSTSCMPPHKGILSFDTIV